jgi:hypothetical protein
MAMLTTVLFFCGGIGFLVAFIYGWVRGKEWRIEQFMWFWSTVFGIIVVLNMLSELLEAQS